MEQESDLLDPIAVIGFSIKFPGEACTPEGFWRMVRDKQSAYQTWPKDRMNLEAFVHKDSKNFVPGAHFMKEDYGLFDASFFGVSGTEANAMDPQIRILLETAYRALENSGIPLETAKGSNTSVYTGCMSNDYRSLMSADPDLLPRYTAIGASQSMLSNRLSWFFDFHGPSLSVDTACSSSLVTLDLACQSLRNGDSKMAMVCGANIIASVEPMLSLANMSFCSPDGRSFSFDSRGNGYGRGEGMGVLIVKRLSDAIRDGNVIRAVIRSTGTNQDGYTPGITQPNQDAQSRLIRETYEKAGLNLANTRYVEAHGTGTAVGDPIEAAAIGSVFGRYRSPEEPLYVGAVKPNIGHLEGGSGIAAVIKAILILEKGFIPPNANFENLNPDIDAEFLNLKIPTELTPWPTEGLRRISVASFGYGGSNAHAILDDAFNFLQSRNLKGLTCSADPFLSASHAASTSRSNLSSQVLVWSTEDEAGVDRTIEAYTDHFQNLDLASLENTSFLPQLANTLATKRSQLQWRSFAIVDSVNALGESLKNLVSKPVRVGKGQNIGFIFTGQGAQYIGMGLELLSYPIFLQTMKQCELVFQGLGCPWSLLELLATNVDGVDDPQYAQPMVTALQISLVELLSSLGVEPSIVVGHSSGEIAAAYSANGLSLASACKVAYYRGLYASLLKKTSTNGAMLAVDLSEKEAQAVLTHLPSETGAEDVYIACVNSPSNVTLSGSAQTITLLKSAFDAEGIVSHLLRTGVAYHTPQMGQVAKAYGNACSNLTSREKPRKRKIIMVSSVTGQEVKDIGVLSTASYWVENMIRPVRFSSAMGRAISRSQGSAKHNRLGASRRVHVSDWVEIGPHSALRGPFRAISQSLSVQNIRYQSVLRRGFSSVRTLQSSLAELYTCGHAINLDQLNQSSLNVGGFERLLVNLPEYPFNHSKRYWFESPFGRNVRLREHKRLQLLGAPAPESTPSEPRWRKFFDTAEAPWLLEHMAGHTPIYPATGMIVMALEAAKQLADQSQQISGYYIHDAKFVHAVAIKTLSKTQAQLNMRSIRHMGDSSSTYEFRVLTEVGDRWELACEGTIAIQYVARAATDNATTSDSHALENSYQQRFEAVSKASLQKVTAAAFYNCMGEVGLQYGPSFRLLDRIQWDGSNTAIGEVSPFGWTKEQSILPPESHIIHPATLDCLGHLGFVSYTKGGTEPFTTGVVVTRIRDAWISGEGAAGEVLQGYGQGKFKGLRSAEMSVFALDRSNKLRVAIPSIQTTSLTVNCPQYQSVESRQLFFSLAWEPESDNMTETFVNGLPEQSNPVLGSLEGFVILIQPESAIQRQLAELIAARLPGSHLQKISIGSAYEINQIPGIEKCMVIFLPEMESPLLADMNQNTFESLQSFFCKAKEILWVTAADPKSISSPRLHIVDGLARVLCTENEQLNFITCHLDDHRMELGLWVDDILTIVRKRVSQSIHDTVRELDYQEKDGKLCVARVSEHEALNNALMDMTQAPAKIRVLGEESRPLTRAIIQPGSLDAENTVFVEDADYGDTEAPLQPHEVEIEVQAVGVNLRDIFTLLGKITDERQLGTECVGIARRVGSASELQPGDRVVAVTLGTHRTLLKCHMDLVIKVPDVLSLAEAAAIPLTAVTAYHALVKLARLERGESVLIHAGAGGTGQLAIQIALNIGAKVFTTVGSEAKRALLQERYNIPADQLLFSRDTSFQRQIMDLTDGRGVDVVLNSLSGDGLVASWSCIAPYGRFIEIGKMDIEANSNLPLIHAGRNVSFSVLAVDHMSQFRPHLIQAALRPVMEMVASGTLKPAWPLHEYSVEDTSEAFRVMQSGRNLGKAVIHMDPKAMVLTSIRPAPVNRFSEHATYVIAGGLGGLGRSAARWMASMGARNLILLSRSGAVTEASKALVQELNDQGVRTSCPQCDVTSLEALKQAFDECADWPPVRGCIQGTMVLKDTIFETLTFEQWTATIRSKVNSTENLHALLPSGLDFFICLSSLSGVIGNISQANYAAGNTFQDAFTRFRRDIGQKAVALDFGWMAEVGVAAENKHYAKIQERNPGMAQVAQAEFHAILEMYCGLSASGPSDPFAQSNTDNDPHQVIVGLMTPAQLQAQGVEPPLWLTNRGIFSSLPQSATDAAPSGHNPLTGDMDLQVEFRQAESAAVATGVVTEGLTQKLARALGMAVGEVDLQRPLALLGVDSLLAVELRHWVRRFFTVEISALDITSAASVEHLAALVIERVTGPQKWIV